MHLNIYAADLKSRQLYRTKKESDGASEDPEGGTGGPDPSPHLKNHKLYGFL